MAQKESYHREVVDDLNTQLTQTRRQLDELTALSRDQVMSFLICIFHMFTFPFRR
jgi:kinesin family protein 4/21/27